MVDPVTNGYAAHIKDPVIEDAGTLSQWEGLYSAILTHLEKLLKGGHAERAYREIPLLMNMAQNFTSNGQNVEVSDKSNFDNTIGKYVNAIQEDFDQYSSGKASTTTYAQDAEYAKQQINSLMTNSKYTQFSSALGTDVTNQLDAMIPTKDSTPTELATYWAGLWKLPTPSTSSSPTAYTGTSPVSNAINAGRNDVESQNTILNSQMQTYSKDASKDLAFEQDCYRAVMNMLKTPVTAAKSAGS